MGWLKSVDGQTALNLPSWYFELHVVGANKEIKEKEKAENC